MLACTVHVLNWCIIYAVTPLKPAFHDADTDTDILVADILARIVARMSAFRSAYHRNNFRKSRLSDVRM